jgi:hypothetical protein
VEADVNASHPRRTLRYKAFLILFFAAIPAAIAAYTGTHKIAFDLRGERCTAQVSAIRTANDTCKGSGKSRERYNCTRFSAEVSFRDVNGSERVATLPAGTSSNHDQAIQKATLALDDSVDIRYVLEPELEIQRAGIFPRYQMESILLLISLIQLLSGMGLVIHQSRTSKH